MAEGKEFSPSPNQEKALAYFKGQDWDCTITAVADHVGITDSAIHHWFNESGFEEWYFAEAARHFKKAMPDVQRAALRAATESKGRQEAKHNPAAIKLYLERFDPDYKPTSRQEMDMSVTFDDALQQLEDAARQVEQG